jgi:hypothetical protein
MGALTMDRTDIIIKSAKGEQEIATRANKLPIKHRSVLIMVDGASSEETLLAKIAGMLDGKTILSDLEIQGFIGRKAGPNPVVKAVETNAQPLNTNAKKFMIDYMYQILGPEADAFVGRIEKCKTNSDLSGMIVSCRDTILGVGKQKRAAEFETKIKELMG